MPDKCLLISFLFLLVIPVGGKSQVKSSLEGRVELYIDSLLTSSFPNADDPGITLGIFRGGIPLYQSSRGMANVRSNLAFNDSTCLGLASVTKQFTAACIGLLHHRGELSLDDDVREVLPELPDYGSTIRIRHLLNHTSGIRNYNVLLDLAGFDSETQGHTNAMMEALIFRQEGVNNLPGEKVLYSNSNYVLLALIVERVSGMAVADFLQDELLLPLGMRHSGFRRSLSEVIPNRARPHYLKDDQYISPTSLNLCVGAGGMYTSIADMALWTHEIQTGEKFPFLRAFLLEQDPLLDGSTPAIARGLFITEFKGLEMVYHGGRVLGMRCHLAMIPSENLAVFVYSNTDHFDAHECCLKIFDEVVAGRPQAESEVPVPVAHAQPQGMVGSFMELNSDLLMTFTFERDTLFARSSMGRDPVPLYFTSDGVIHRLDNPSVCYRISGASPQRKLEVDFSGAVFYFEEVELVEAMDPADFAGQYYSDELDVTYIFSDVDGGLVLSYSHLEGVSLSPRRKDEFGTGWRVRYSFVRGEDGAVLGMNAAAEGTVKDIWFERVGG